MSGIRINVEEGRNPGDKGWDLPPWGHPLAQGILPLFLEIDEHLFPIGTAFSVGKKIRFLMTAEHTIGEAVKCDPYLDRLRNEGKLPAKADLQHARLRVLYQRKRAGGGIEFMMWPIEHVDGAPPTDVVFAFPKFVEGYPTIAFPLTFGLPAVGARVFSAGYTDVRVPEGGLPLDEISAGTFDWSNYSHRFYVMEGRVERIFTQRFARGYLDGPCFVFDGEIPHGLSGGPVFTTETFVLGVNSAAATQFFGEPKSLASLLYPLLPIKLSVGLQEGAVRLSAQIPLIDLIAQGSLTTDGSEQSVGIVPEGDDSFVVSPVCKEGMFAFVHDDYRGFQDGKSATTSETLYRFNRGDES